jgi:hypothetical protein
VVGIYLIVQERAARLDRQEGDLVARVDSDALGKVGEDAVQQRRVVVHHLLGLCEGRD